MESANPKQQLRYRAISCPRYLPDEVSGSTALRVEELILSAAIRGHGQSPLAEHSVIASSMWAAVRRFLADGKVGRVDVVWGACGGKVQFELHFKDVDASVKVLIESCLPRMYRWQEINEDCRSHQAERKTFRVVRSGGLHWRSQNTLGLPEGMSHSRG